MMIAVFLALFGAADESTYYTVETIPSPQGEVIEVGGMDFLSDGSLVLSTRRGRVWIVENPDAEDPAAARWHLFADGLAEGLGLSVIDDDIYVTQRTELSRLRDVDGDRRVDHIDTITDDWGVTDNYHEYAFGLPVDDDGNLYLTLNLAFINPEWWHGQSVAPWRGWMLKVSPDGEVTPFASGFRSPCGVGMTASGDLLVTDNQGDWMPVCPIYHVQEGGFYGHPNSLRWTQSWQQDGEIPDDNQPVSHPRKPAAIWIPYDWSRSTGNLVANLTDGQFGPFDEQMFVAELTNGMVLRADLEKVNGEYQGAIWPFRTKIGSVCRVRFGPDGTLYAGLTNRGWGGMEPGHGLRRIRFTGVEPLEMQTIHLIEDGFEIGFTKPLAADVNVSPEAVTARTYRYNWWWEYGSPEQDKKPLPVTETTLSPDRTTLTIRTPDLKAGRCVRVRLTGLRSEDGHDLLHEEFSYTVNQMPGSTAAAPHVALQVAPPLERGGTSEAGWIRLTWGDPLDRVQGEGWRLGGAVLDENNNFTAEPGNALLINDAADCGDLVLPEGTSDGRLRMSVFLPAGGAVGIALPNGVRVELRDHPGPTPSATIQILDGDDRVLAESAVDFWFGPGQWQTLEIDYRGPRLSDSGQHLDHGHVGGVYLEDVAVIGPVDVPADSPANTATTAARVLGHFGPAGISDIRFHANALSGPDDGIDLIAVGSTDAAARGGGIEVHRHRNVLQLTGTGHFLWSELLPESYDLIAYLRCHEGTDGTLDLGGDLRIHLGHTPPDRVSTGTLVGLDEVTAQLIPDGNWFTLRVQVRLHEGMRNVEVWINGVKIAAGSAAAIIDPVAPRITRTSGEIDLAELRVVSHGD